MAWRESARGVSEKRDEEMLIERALERAASGRGQEQINMRDFIEDYGENPVAADEVYVRDMEARFARSENPAQREAKKLADVLEAILTEQIELSDWLGEDVTTRKTTKFDDIKNGVDLVAEIEREQAIAHLALALDVTYATSISDKFRRIQDEIDRGELTTIKYFESSSGRGPKFRGRLSKVPRVILGVNRKTVLHLAELWITNKKKDLAEHPAQVEILEEIALQLNAFREYAQGLENTAVAEELTAIYDQQIAIVKSILSSDRVKKLRENIDSDSAYRETDETYQAIRAGVASFKRPAKA